jgi:Ca-activated chloride channel family protein
VAVDHRAAAVAVAVAALAAAGGAGAGLASATARVQLAQVLATVGAWHRVRGCWCWRGCACLTAAARPQWIGPPQAQQRSGRALMLAVDLSGSMRTEDMDLAGQAVSRFGAVEAIAGDFIVAAAATKWV